MLGKLIKHEYIYITKTFLPLYIIYIILAILTKAVILLSESDLFNKVDSASEITLITFVSIIVGAYGIFTCGLGFMTIANNMKRFKNNMFSDEGYLTNTLPVTATEHILSKIIGGATNFLVSIIVVLLGILLLSGKSTFAAADFVSGLWEVISSDKITAAQRISVLFTALLGYIAVMLLGYFVTSLESLLGSSKVWSGLIGAFCGYFSVMAISRIIGATIITMGVDDVEKVFFIISGFLALISAIFYALTVYIMKHKLNLQ